MITILLVLTRLSQCSEALEILHFSLKYRLNRIESTIFIYIGLVSLSRDHSLPEFSILEIFELLFPAL